MSLTSSTCDMLLFVVSCRRRASYCCIQSAVTCKGASRLPHLPNPMAPHKELLQRHGVALSQQRAHTGLVDSFANVSSPLSVLSMHSSDTQSVPQQDLQRLSLGRPRSRLR